MTASNETAVQTETEAPAHGVILTDAAAAKAKAAIARIDAALAEEKQSLMGRLFGKWS